MSVRESLSRTLRAQACHALADREWHTAIDVHRACDASADLGDTRTVLKALVRDGEAVDRHGGAGTEYATAGASGNAVPVQRRRTAHALIGRVCELLSDRNEWLTNNEIAYALGITVASVRGATQGQQGRRLACRWRDSRTHEYGLHEWDTGQPYFDLRDTGSLYVHRVDGDITFSYGETRALIEYLIAASGRVRELFDSEATHGGY